MFYAGGRHVWILRAICGVNALLMLTFYTHANVEGSLNSLGALVFIERTKVSVIARSYYQVPFLLRKSVTRPDIKNP